MDGTYIKLRIRWLSDCFQIYLRNTRTICEQHNTAMRSMNEKLLKAVTVSYLNMPSNAVHIIGIEHDDITDIEDED